MQDQSNNLDLGIIGNCQIAALIDSRARMVWACWPQLDADPVFCRLLQSDAVQADPDTPGSYAVELDRFSHSAQRYLRNTAIIETTLYDDQDGAVRITDFAPRHAYLGRMYRPIMLLRRIEIVAGAPRIRILLRPAHDYAASARNRVRGSNHIRYVGDGEHTMRLTTDASISRVIDGSWFVPDRTLHLILGPDESVTESPAECFRTNFDATSDYWQNWSRGLSIPFEWQAAVIRAAISLKLCTFEDTGAVVAAVTTSLPEAADSGRNWDYRFCWLRDSYFVVHALNRLGATKTMEAYLGYITALVADMPADGLQPVYAINGDADLTERTVDSLAGYRDMGPVRVGNQAYEQIQHDVYGAVVLSATQLFFDERLANPGGPAIFERLEILGEQAVAVHDQPDAGLWEYRGRKRVHTFSTLMCWAACDRLAHIAQQLALGDRAEYWRAHADTIRGVIEREAWDEDQQAYTESLGRPELDASLLMMHELGFVAADDPRFVGTVRAIGAALKRGHHLFRYNAADDFGEPENAFNICTFWYIEALSAMGEHAEAREMFEHILDCRNPLGLLSEDINPDDLNLWGNFPQTYSMAGIINVAMRLSRSWEDAL
ncbi:MAG: glycoside hydrolase family 15 protein [Pseudomonadota bacterium]